MKSRFLMLILLLTACTAPVNTPAGTGVPSPSASPPPSGTEAELSAPVIAATATAASLAEAAGAFPPVAGTPDSTQASQETPNSPVEVSITAKDGLGLHAALRQGVGPPPWPGVLLLHMARSSRRDWRDFAPQLASRGYAVLSLDLRGHGDTGGTRDWEKVPGDIQRALEYLSNRTDIDPSRLAIVGASLGSNLAIVTGAADPETRGLVLLSPGINYYDVKTDEAITAYGDRPVLIVVSEEDGYPARSSTKLAGLALGEVQLKTYPGSAHGTEILDLHPDLAGLILDWLDQHVRGDRAEIEATPVPASGENPSGFPSRITDAMGVTMVLVPAGPYEMGSDPEIALAECEKLFIGGDCSGSWASAEGPVHTVNLEAFYIDQYEVTNARYAECVSTGPCNPPAQESSLTRSKYYGTPSFDDHPVVWVSWENAAAYCAWRGARLPTEAEWEKAARGTDGRIYPWGNTFDGSRVNFCDKNCQFLWSNPQADDGFADTARVGSFPGGMSPYGAYDMAGNVDEWVADFFDAGYYAVSPPDNPLGPPTGELRVLRGGSFHTPGQGVRVTARPMSDPTGDYIGFRCAATPE